MVSQALLDRIDLCVEAREITFEQMQRHGHPESSAEIRKRVERTHAIQLKRYEGKDYHYNAQIPNSDIELFCAMDKECIEHMEEKFEEYQFSARTYNQVVRTARTIADMDGEEQIRLRHINNAPFAIFVIGDPPSDQKKSIGIVGARGCSEYGRSVAQKLGKTLAEHGAQVVSGMAVGVDSASQAGALSAGGATFAVLGSGCDVCYPRSSGNIYENIISGHGGIISELLPGTQPLPRFFPMRNRIILALSDIVVVVEAREKSGSLITTDFALEQGKDVYAVPGRYLDPLSVGYNRLIEQGAGIFVDMDTFLKNSGIVSEVRKNGKKSLPPLTEAAEKVYDCLKLSVKYIDDNAAQSGLDLLTVFEALGTLKKNKLAQETFQNYFCRII